MSKWVKGQSGNPSGRSASVASVARKIAKETSNFDELVDGLLEFWRNPKNPKRERLLALQELLNRGLGKAINTSELTLTLDPPLPVAVILSMPPSERLKWISAERERRALPPVPLETGETDHE